jgi:acyl-CoA thioesterase-1
MASMREHPLMAILAFALAVPAWPAQAQSTLVFLGDSLTAGYGLDRSESFPSLLEAHLRRSGLPWKVVNAGVSGDTSAGALARLDWIYRAKVDFMVVCIGSNDGLRGLPPALLERNLGAILDRARREGTRVMLVGALMPDNYGKDYQEAFRAVFPRVAKAHHVPFMPFLLEGVALDPRFVQEDGLHPNAEGTRRVAESLWKLLEPRLRRRP